MAKKKNVKTKSIEESLWGSADKLHDSVEVLLSKMIGNKASTHQKTPAV